jgi:hypothetical protein
MKPVIGTIRKIHDHQTPYSNKEMPDIESQTTFRAVKIAIKETS